MDAIAGALKDARLPAESHAEAVALLALAEKAGADAVVSVTPYYARPPQRGLIAFFVDLAARTELPFLIYHIPGRAAVSVAAETFEAIAERRPNFVGLKNTDDDLALVSRLISRLGPNFRIFGGLREHGVRYVRFGRLHGHRPLPCSSLDIPSKKSQRPRQGRFLRSAAEL
jgi:dihydrodipicolinate synthase/N-acetylneuraminate lyase